MVANPRPDGTVKIAGRWWTPEQIFLFGRDWTDPLLTRSEACRIHGVRVGSIRNSAWAQKMLGIDAAPKRRGGGKSPGKISVPKHAHPLVRKVYREIIAQDTTAKDVCREAGFGKEGKTIYQWRSVLPRIDNLEAALNVLGFKLIVVPIDADTRSLEQRAA